MSLAQLRVVITVTRGHLEPRGNAESNDRELGRELSLATRRLDDAEVESLPLSACKYEQHAQKYKSI